MEQAIVYNGRRVKEMHGYFGKIRNCRFVAREICDDIKRNRVTEDQGKEALFMLLLTACGAKAKNRKGE